MMALASGTIATGAFLPSTARADVVGSLRTRAATIASELQAAYARLDALDEAYNQAEIQAAVLQKKLTFETQAIQATGRTLGKLQGRLREEAVIAYVNAASGGDVGLLFDGAAQQGPMQQAYIQASSDNLDQAVSDVEIAEHQLRDHQFALRQAEAGAEAARAQIARTRVEAQTETATLTSTLSQVKGQLVQAVAAQERASQAAAAAAAAKAAAQQAAADQAAAAAAAAAQAAAQKAAPPPTTQPAPPPPTTRPPSTPPTTEPPSTPPTTQPSPPPTTLPPPVTGGGSGAAAVRAAETQLGVPYVWGGATPGVGFDCSGLTMWAWAQAGVQLAHGATDQYYAIPHVSMSSLQPGDLIFYGTASYLDHVVMYVGSGPYGSQTVIAAQHTGTNVMFAQLWPGAYGAGQP
jgi:cell wall-associated NlpC family hydrolase